MPRSVLSRAITSGNGRGRPRLCFVGPHPGGHPGWVTTQGEILTGLFAEAGYEVRATSPVLQPMLRVVDMLRSLWSWRRQIDLVVLAVFSGRAFWAADAISRWTRRLGLPQAQVLRGGAFPDFGRRHGCAVARLLRRADVVIAPSPYLGEWATTFGIDAKVIANVLSIEHYPMRLRTRLEPKLLWVRTFHDIYHPRLAIEVLTRLHATGIDASLTMAGQDKGLLAEMKALAARRASSAHVRFPGFLDIQAKQQEFAKHDIFLHTNHIDNTPVTVLEAAAFGLPIVATKVGGIPYLLTNEHDALLVEDGDSQAMAEAVRCLLDRPRLAEDLSRNGRVLAESCSWPQVHAAWQDVFAELLTHD